MSAYLVVDTKINNPEVYEEYKKLAKPIAEKYGGVYRVRGGARAPRKSIPKKPAPSSEGTVSNVDTVFEAIKNADGGINNASIIEKTGLAQKQVANVVFKLKKQGKIKAVGRGVFTSARLNDYQFLQAGYLCPAFFILF